MGRVSGRAVVDVFVCLYVAALSPPIRIYSCKYHLWHHEERRGTDVHVRSAKAGDVRGAYAFLSPCHIPWVPTCSYAPCTIFVAQAARASVPHMPAAWCSSRTGQLCWTVLSNTFLCYRHACNLCLFWSRQSEKGTAEVAIKLAPVQDQHSFAVRGQSSRVSLNDEKLSEVFLTCSPLFTFTNVRWGE